MNLTRPVSICRGGAAATAVLAVLCLQPAAQADGTWSAQFENDRFANTDRHYTHGTRFAWVSDKEDGSDLTWARDLLQMLYPLASVREGRVGFAVGQNIYTPADTNARALVRGDRPYAGWLYASASVHAETQQSLMGRYVGLQDSVEVNLGVVGPAALGRQTQNNFHDLIGVARSNGWDNQLSNEPAVLLIADRRWRVPVTQVGELEIDALPHVGGSVGNVLTHANVGMSLRLGQDLAIDFGAPRMRPTLSGLAAVEKRTGLSWYVFAGAEGRAVAHDLFLDGNTLASSHDVSRNPFVADMIFGASVVYRGVRLSFTTVLRSREFDGQDKPDKFGSVTLSTNF